MYTAIKTNIQNKKIFTLNPITQGIYDPNLPLGKGLIWGLVAQGALNFRLQRCLRPIYDNAKFSTNPSCHQWILIWAKRPELEKKGWVPSLQVAVKL